MFTFYLWFGPQTAEKNIRIFGLWDVQIFPCYMLTLALCNVLARRVMGAHGLRAAHVKSHWDSAIWSIKQWDESCKVVETRVLILSGTNAASSHYITGSFDKKTSFLKKMVSFAEYLLCQFMFPPWWPEILMWFNFKCQCRWPFLSMWTGRNVKFNTALKTSSLTYEDSLYSNQKKTHLNWKLCLFCPFNEPVFLF